jgi:hypothetical protein
VGASLLLAACGQRGDLYLPQTPEAAQRTRLPGIVFLPTQSPAQSPASAASSPASAPQSGASDAAPVEAAPTR